MSGDGIDEVVVKRMANGWLIQPASFWGVVNSRVSCESDWVWAETLEDLHKRFSEIKWERETIG